VSVLLSNNTESQRAYALEQYKDWFFGVIYSKYKSDGIKYWNENQTQ